MALKSCLEPLFKNNPQSFPECIEHGGRSGMVVNPLLSPVFFKFEQIEIETLNFCLSRSQDIHGPGTDREGRKSRRYAEPFLGATVTNINSPFVHFHLTRTKGSDGIDDEEGIILLKIGPNFFEGFSHDCGRFSMDEAAAVCMR